LLFDADASALRADDEMTPRGKWPPFPWNPADLDNPLIGRELALRDLGRTFEDVVTDWVVRVQLVVSDYGLGKSRLLADFVAAARAREPSALVVRVRCPETGGPYRLWDAILRETFAIPAAADGEEAGALLARAVSEHLGEASEDIAGLIGHLVGYTVPGSVAPPVGTDTEALVARCGGALGRLLEAIAFTRPAVIVVTQANRASARDFALASAVEATMTGRPIMMVFAGTPELTDHLPGWDRFPVVRLGPLGRDDADRLLRLLLTGVEDGLPRRLHERVLATSAGNAYALKAIVRFLHETGGIVDHGGRYGPEPSVLDTVVIPDSLEGVIQARITALSPDERATLAQAAVAGREFWLGALVALGRQHVDVVPAPLDADASPDRLRHLLGKLVAQRFIEPRASRIHGEEAFVFRSEAHWEAALELLPATVRERFHRTVGDWLALQVEADTGPFAGELARHAEGAGDLAVAAERYLLAAQRFLAENQGKAALRCLERAHRLTPPDRLATRLRVLFALGELHANAGATDEARRNFEAALELAWRMRDRRRGARALGKLGDIEQSHGNYDEAAQHLDASLRLFEAIQDHAGVASTCTALGRLYWLRGAFEDAIRCYRKSEHIYRRLGNQRGIAEILHAVGAVHHDRGDVSRAESFYTEALTLREAAGDRRGIARTLNNLGIIWMARSLERSVEVWRRASDIAREIGDLGLQATLADNLGEALVLLGRYDEADGFLGRAVELAELTGRKRTLVDALRNQGLLRVALGDLDGAESVLSRAKRQARVLGLARLDALVSRALGDLAVARMESTGVIADHDGDGALALAEAAYRQAAERFESSGYHLEAATSYERLADMLELAGRGAEAASRRDQAGALRGRLATAAEPPPVPA